MEKIMFELKSLRLSGMAKTLQQRIQEAKANDLGCLEFLERLVDDEIGRRRDNLINRRLKMANFPTLKTLEDFDFSFNPAIPKKDVKELTSCRFIHEGTNVLFVGPPGVGKTHLATAIGIQAVQNAYTTYYRSAFDLVDDLAEASRENTRKRAIASLTKQQLLIIDEFGMKKMPLNAADDFLEIIHRRHGHSATIIATNRPIEDWGVILGDNAATSAILDRFLQKAVIFAIKGKSYRMNKRKDA